MTKIQSLLRHIQLVRDNGIIVGEKLIENKEEKLGRLLIRNVLCHDQSKFNGVEWEAFFNGKDELIPAAILHHNHTNLHHPEFWPNGIKSMPLLYVAEMSLDWMSRSQEQCDDIEDWIHKVAFERFGFTKEDSVFFDIMHFLELAKKPIN